MQATHTLLQLKLKLDRRKPSIGRHAVRGLDIAGFLRDDSNKFYLVLYQSI